MFFFKEFSRRFTVGESVLFVTSKFHKKGAKTQSSQKENPRAAVANQSDCYLAPGSGGPFEIQIGSRDEEKPNKRHLYFHVPCMFVVLGFQDGPISGQEIANCFLHDLCSRRPGESRGFGGWICETLRQKKELPAV